MKTNNVILFLMGPTGIGKSYLSLELANILNINIISVDSSMVYRHMDIGTSKPNKVELMNYKHYLINIRDPNVSYSVGEFCKDAYKIINFSFNTNKIPCFIGGSMMYFWYFQNNLYKFLNEYYIFKSKYLNTCNLNLYKSYYKKYFYNYNIDYIQACFIDYYFNNYSIINIAIVPTCKFDLYNKIRQRYNNMLSLGFIEEVKYLYDRGDLSLNNVSMKSIGYRQIWHYLDNKISFYDTSDIIIKMTNYLVKRQLTWLNSWKNKIYFIENDELSIANKIKNLVLCKKI